MEHQPDEKLTARGSPGFPDPSPRTKLDGSHKEGRIGRFTAVRMIL
jgi:hypothetical protein